MKRNIILKGVLGVLLLGGLASCSDDYLDIAPKTNTDSSTASGSVEGASLALNGMCRSMYMQYGNISTTPNFQGEPYIAMTYGEMQGQDDILLVWLLRYGVPFANWINNTQQNGIMPAWAWKYCYSLIAQANNVLQGEETAIGEEKERKNVMACVRTIRAHAYFRLLQLYAPRWEDSNNGDVKCVVLRTKPGVEQKDCAKMIEVLDQIYEDLDKAIQMFQESGVTKSQYKWIPNIDVARGIYARAAMLKHDYAKAQQMAHDARQNYPIMSADQYEKGFQPNDEWMWANAAELTGIYYWAWGSWYACNGAYPSKWGYGAGAMNYELYKKIPMTDIRKRMYLMPEACELNGVNIRKANFWKKNACEPTSMNLNYNMASVMFGIEDFNKNRQIRIEGVEDDILRPYFADTEGTFRIPFGAQYKVWSIDTYGTNSMPFMRGAEMLLTEAEAAYHNNQPGVAQQCLEELYAKRNPGQKCTATGDALLDEIRTQRRIELWGEGFNWFDLKRWNMPCVRNIWVEGDENSNNIPAQFKMRKEADDRGWRLVIPQSELEYNQMINQSTLGYE